MCADLYDDRRTHAKATAASGCRFLPNKELIHGIPPQSPRTSCLVAVAAAASAADAVSNAAAFAAAIASAAASARSMLLLVQQQLLLLLLLLAWPSRPESACRKL